MDKLSLESLFKCTTNNNTTNVLDVRTITRNQKPFDVNVLLETRQKKREKLLIIYQKTYELCIKNIELANNLGKTDLIFTIRDFVSSCPEYKSINCINYIRDRLQKKLFNIYVVDNKTIFITWLYLEVNTDQANENKYENKYENQKENENGFYD